MALCAQESSASRQSPSPARLAVEHVLSDMAICWEISAFAGSLRVLASVSSGVCETVRQLKPSFHAPFLYILASPPGSQQYSAGVRWQLGTEAWEPLPPLGSDQGGLFSGNVEVVVLKGCLYVLAEAIKHGNKEYNLQAFDPVGWEWCPLVHVPVRECESLLELGGRLYILGRSVANDGSCLPKLFRFDPDHGTACCDHELEVLPPFSTPRCYMGTAVLGGCIYAVGGYAADLLAIGAAQPLPVAERFDPGSGIGDGSWIALPPMKRPRFLCKATVLKGCLYVLGGLSTGGIETTLERFEPSNGTWSVLAPMPTMKGAIEVTECAGQILVFGGTDLVGSRRPEVERYDPLANRWSKMPNIGNRDSALDSVALVGPADNLLSVFTETNMRDTNLVIQHYHDRSGGRPASWRVPTHRGHLRVVRAMTAE